MRPKTLAAAISLLGLPVQGREDRIAGCLGRHDASGSSASPFSKNIYNTSFPGVSWDEDHWLLSTTELKQGAFQARGSVANGYLGINVAAAGPFFEQDSAESGDVISGWPLFSRRQTFATIAGFFDSQPTTEGVNFPWLAQYGGDSVISGVPHWSGLILDLGDGDYLDANVDSKDISQFRSTYDYKAGVLTWSYTWTPSRKTDKKTDKKTDSSFHLTYRLFASKLHVNQAVVDLEIVPSAGVRGIDAVVANVLEGAAAVRTDFVSSGEDEGAIFSAVSPVGVPDVVAYVYANLTGSGGVDLSRRTVVAEKPYVHCNESSVVQTVPVRLSAGQTTRITKFVGAASSDAFTDPRKTARDAVLAASQTGYSHTLASHVTEWAAVMPEDSVDSYADPKSGKLPADEFIVDSAIMAVVNAYYLLQNTVGSNAIAAAGTPRVNVDSISVGGLTSDSYAGQVFWDADLWMQPGLVAGHPEAAARIINYRVNQYAQAKANVKTAFAGSQNTTYFSPESAIFSWTGGRYGNCTVTGPCWDYEYHINGDIGLALINQWVASGDTALFRDTLLPVYDSVAQLYADLLVRNGSAWTLTNMTDPDEYANHVDAGAYTMALVAETLTHANAFREQFGAQPNATWTEMAANVQLLRQNGVTLEFTTMNGSAVVKQADAIMATYPLARTANYSRQDALNDLEYYAGKQSPDGPAMTYAFFSIVASQMAPSGCSAYTYAQYGFRPYVRAPFYQLSEQLVDNSTINGGTHPAFPFLTGHGGHHQVVLFGYLGLRLMPDDVLHIDPSLPPQIPYVRYRTFYWRGWPIEAWSNATHTTLSRGKPLEKGKLDTADLRFGNAIAVQVGEDPTVFSLSPGESVVVPNRRPGWENTVEGNLGQCRPAYSSEEYVPGQFPMAAVDGATSTKWQPVSAHEVSSLTVTLEEGTVSGFYFDWAQSPPVNATVVFHDGALGGAGDRVVAELVNIELSRPYDAVKAAVDAVEMPASNTTSVGLAEAVKGARYATLMIVGNQGLGEGDVGRNGSGATVAEWAILGER